MEIFLIILCMIMLSIIIILIVSLNKLFKLNDTLVNQHDTLKDQLDKIKLYVFEAYMNMRAVDTLGAFEADDDAGYMFEAIKKIIIDLGIYSVDEIRVLYENPELTDPRAKQFVSDLYEKLKKKREFESTINTEEVNVD